MMKQKLTRMEIGLLAFSGVYAAAGYVLAALNPAGYMTKLNIAFVALFVLAGLVGLYGAKLRELASPCKLLGALLLAGSGYHVFKDYTWHGMAMRMSAATILLWIPVCLGVVRLLQKFIALCRTLPKRNENVGAAIVFGVSVIELCLFFTLHYPVVVGRDPLNQYWQIKGLMPYQNIHTPMHTMILRVLLGISGDSWTFVILVQIAAFALLLALFARRMIRRGAPMCVVVLAAVLTCSSLSRLEPMVNPVKDVPYTIAIGCVTLLIMRALEKEKQSVWESVLLGLALSWTVLMRFNGIIVLLGIGALALIAQLRRGGIRQAVAMILTIIVCMVGSELFFTHVLHGEKKPNGISVQVFASGVAAAMNDNPSQEEMDRAAKVLDVQYMQEKYQPWDEYRKLLWTLEDEIVNNYETDVYCNHFVKQCADDRIGVIKLYFSLLPNHFSACVWDVIYNTSSIWGHRYHNSGFWLYDHSVLLVLWLLAMAAQWKPEHWKRSAVLLPVLLNTLSIAISAATNELRYILPMTLLGLVLMVYILWPGETKTE